MANFNRIIMVGNLTRDPDFKQFDSGQGVCRLGIASNRQYRNRQTGALVQEVCFIDIDVWGVQAERCKQYLQKGRQVLVEGRLKFDQWQDGEGQNRSRHTIVADRIVFLGNTQAESADQASDFGSLTPATPDGSNFESLTGKKHSSKKNTYATAAVNNDFKDEPPFEDELPF